MSRVTDTFIFTSVLFDPRDTPRHQEIIHQINAYKGGSQSFHRLDDNHAAYGGSKVFAARIWCAAYDHLGVDEFISYLRDLDWPEDVWVQLCYQVEDDEGFTLVTVKGG